MKPFLRIVFPLFIILFFCCNNISAQNLVLNPSFEVTNSNCANFGGEGFFTDLTASWDNASNNAGGDSCSSPDLFSACNTVFGTPGPTFMPGGGLLGLGYQYSHTGTRHAGIITYEALDEYREYIQGRLTSPLIGGQTYCVSMYVSLADYVPYATNNMGVYFSTTHYLRDPCPGQNSSGIYVTPQLNYTCGAITDTTENWVRLQWNYVAAGGEQYFIIGNFFHNAQTTIANTGQSPLPNPFAYYFIDDVSVVPNTCCFAQITSHAPFCTTDAPATLAVTTGTGTSCSPVLNGLWSGAGITNSTTGAFSPTVAGVGAHVISYTLSCGYTDTATIVVGPCAPLSVCSEINGNFTASNGLAPYTWYQQVQQQNCSACIFGCAIPPGCAVNVNAWQSFSTATSVTPPGTYPLRVVDNSGTELVIANAGAVSPCSACSLTASASSSNATCGSSNGSATATAAGGTPSSYAWSNGGNTATISNVAAGNYTVTVTGGGCTATASVTVAQTGAVTTSTSSTNAGCSPIGSATVTPGGGNGSFTYLWSNGGTGATISNVAAGTYTVTVTSAGCTATASVTVAQTGAVTTSTSSTNAGCLPTGSATVTPGGGNGSFTYLWSNGGTGATISNVAAGTYTVTVTSASCTATASVTVAQTGTVTTSTSSTNAGCSPTGSATVTPNGGNGSFTYLWSNGGTGATISNVAAGTYMVTVTSSGCTATASVTVSATGTVNANTSTTNAGCTSTGSATVTPSGGTGSFTYLWSNGGTGATISNISGGTYTVTITSGNCTATAVANVISAGGVTLSPSSTNTTCGNSNGAASVTATTGSAPFTYLWSTGATSSGVTNVAAGTYTVTVGDGGGCTATANILVNASTVTPALIVTNDSLICSGDSTQICVTGNYTTYNWNTGQTTQCIYAKLAGNYYVTAIDANTCTASSNRIPINVYPSPPVSISVNGDTLTAYNAVTYQWYYNNTLIPNATSNIYIAPASGDYSIVVTDTNGCRATSTKVSVIKTGIFSLGKEEVVKIYPNPLESGYWNLEVGNSLLGSWVEVFDDNGRLVYKSEIGNLKSEINLHVASGIYMMRISSNTSIITHKLIKL